MPIRKELLDELLKEYKNPDDLLGEDGLLKQLTKALVERAMEAELTHHLGYEKHAPEGRNSGNSRNGTSSKTVTGKNGQLELEVPRDRNGTFEPKIVRKRQKRFDGFDEKIISMYARGMTVREIQAHLEEIYSVEVSPDLISSVTDAVIDQVRAWQARPLDALYPILYLDALVVKVREQGRVTNRAVYVAIGVNASGHKEVLGFWIAETEGAKFWLSVVTELRNRGIKDLFLACVDGLKGFAEAIEAVFPQALVQSCIVHQMRNSLAFVSYKDRKGVAASLKPIYRAVSEQAAVAALEEFEAEWSERYPLIGKSWRANWTRITPFFAFPDEIRRAVYTTNAIESLNYSLRKIIKNRSLFPNDEALSKLLYLALNNASKKWRMPIKDWGRAMSQFAILFEDRVPLQLP
jgi:putative transposase